MRRLLPFTVLALSVLFACGRPAAQATPQIVSVYASSASAAWLAELYDCAAGGPAVIVTASDPAAADLQLRLGEPVGLMTPAYQLAMEDVLVVVHPQAGVGALTLEQVRQVFSGRAANWKDVGGNDLPVQVWVYSPGVDIEGAFEAAVLQGGPVTSLARLAVSAQDMSDSVGGNPGAAGILTRHWKAGNTREAMLAVSVPVLAITRSEPEGGLRDLIACLQK